MRKKGDIKLHGGPHHNRWMNMHGAYEGMIVEGYNPQLDYCPILDQSPPTFFKIHTYKLIWFGPQKKGYWLGVYQG